jgi:hypothetical protein
LSLYIEGVFREQLSLLLSKSFPIEAGSCRKREENMGDRSVGKRLAALRDDVVRADPGLRLSDEELDDIEKVGAEGLKLLYSLRAESDIQTINALCDVYEPRLTTILYSTNPEEKGREERKDDGYDIIS